MSILNPTLCMTHDSSFANIVLHHGSVSRSFPKFSERLLRRIPVNSSFCKLRSIYKSTWHHLIGSFSLSQGIRNIFLATSLVFLSCHFYIFNPDFIRYSVKIIRNKRRLDIVLKLATYQWEVSQLKIQ